MKRLLTSIAFVLAAAAGQASQDNWLYWSVADAATLEGAVEFAYAVLCDSEDWTRTYTVGETGASKVRANADALSTPAVASNISGTASAESGSFAVLLYDVEDEVVAVSEAVSRDALVKHVYIDLRAAGEGTPYVFSFFAKRICVKPGEPLVFDKAEAATNAAAKAVLTPSADVAAALGSDAAIATYRNMFTLDVVPTSDGKWAVAALLLPEPWTNVVQSARSATRQIPVADIAKLGLGDVLEKVPLTNCVPGFYYSLYDGSSVTNLKADINENNGNILCGPDTTVTIPVLSQPAPASGFFTIDVLEIPTVYVPGSDHILTGSIYEVPGGRRLK